MDKMEKDIKKTLRFIKDNQKDIEKVLKDIEKVLKDKGCGDDMTKDTMKKTLNSSDPFFILHYWGYPVSIRHYKRHCWN